MKLGHDKYPEFPDGSNCKLCYDTLDGSGPFAIGYSYVSYFCSGDYEDWNHKPFGNGLSTIYTPADEELIYLEMIQSYRRNHG